MGWSAHSAGQAGDTVELSQRLEGIVGAGHVRGGDDCVAYAVDGRRPEVVVFPGTAEEVSALLAVCHEAGAAVTPWGGGTGMGLGRTPDRLDVVVCTRRLNQVLDHEPGDMTSTAQAGIALQDYQTLLGKSGQFLALDPPHADRATLGGILASNASGPSRLRYGTMRDQVIGLRVVAADGTVTRAGAKVVKNVTGYDLNKLYVGSLGTLGVIVEASFRLYPLPPHEVTWLGRFPGTASACAVVACILDSSLVPVALELLNVPAAIHVTRHAGPLIEPGSWLAITLASLPEAIQTQLGQIRDIAGQAGSVEGRLLEGEAHERFWQGVRDIEPEGAGTTLKASVLPAVVAPACELAERWCAEMGLALRIVAEAGTGVIRFFLGAPSGGEPDGARLAALVETLRTFAGGARGSLVVLHAPPGVKAALDVWGPVGEALALMRELKRSFDPRGILNPGRFVGGI